MLTSEIAITLIAGLVISAIAVFWAIRGDGGEG